MTWNDHPSAAILEGTPEFREALRGALAELGISVRTAGSWDEARALLRDPDASFSVGIVDVNLPGEPGDSAAEGFSLLPGGRWPIFLSCEELPSGDEVEKTHRGGIIGYLRKAADVHETAFRVQAYLEGRLTTGHLTPLRARVLATVQITSGDFSDSRSRLGLLRNISPSGMLVSVVSVPAVGSRVSLCFQLPPRGIAICCEGRVVWCESEAGMIGTTVAAIEFETLGVEAQEIIRAFVLDNLRESSGHIR